MRCSFPTFLRSLLLSAGMLDCIIGVSVYAEEAALDLSYSASVKNGEPRQLNVPVTIQAHRMEGISDQTILFEQDVEIVKGAVTLRADQATYRQQEQEVQANGHVSLHRFGNWYWGDSLDINLDTAQGVVQQPRYKLKRNNGQGHAEQIKFEGQEQATILEGTYSTCEGSNPDWYIRSSRLSVDTEQDVGTATRAALYFKDTVILGAPSVTFPLSDKRRSGVLPPIIGSTSRGGLELTVPYYLDLAPNHDVTLYPKIITKRGLQMGLNGRYLEQHWNGEVNLEGLIQDQQTGAARWSLGATHQHELESGWSYGWNVNAASDDQYSSDFANSITASSQRLLPREVHADYTGPESVWHATVRATNYQVLQDVAAPIVRPYDRLPQLSVYVGQQDVHGFDWTMDTEITRFWHPESVRGDRFVSIPTISYPILNPGYFITPKLALNIARYRLNTVSEDEKKTFSRAIPTGSLDMGLVFERDTDFLVSHAKQTLEPRFFYVKTPYQDQSAFPNFDTADVGFGLAQIFSASRFSGQDRVGDADQMTVGLTSRWIESSGRERIRLDMGQRFYFDTQRVTLGSVTQSSRSDLLLGIKGQLSSTFSVDTAAQYNEGSKLISHANLGAHWKSGTKQLINFDYRYVRDDADPKLIDFSTKWPIDGRWYGVGRINYAVQARKMVDGLFGAEYNADCWAFRAVAHRYATATQETTTALFFQLELNGLSRLGINPLDVLKRSIPGYQ